MIQGTALTAYIERQLPELTPALHPTDARPLSVYASVGCMLDYTRNKMHEHNLSATRKCFDVAASLHADGDPSVRRAVENVFVYALSELMDAHGASRGEVMPLLPQSLRELYAKQVFHYGC